MLTWLVADADAESFRLARIGVGLAALLQAPISLDTLLALTEPGVLTTPVIGGLGLQHGWQVMALIVVWGVAGIGFTVGYRLLLSGSALGISLALPLLLDHQAYSNHLYLMALMVGLLTLAGGRRKQSEDTPSSAVFWPVLLVMTQISAVYLFTAFSKMNEDFIGGQVLASTVRDGVDRSSRILADTGQHDGASDRHGLCGDVHCGVPVEPKVQRLCFPFGRSSASVDISRDALDRRVGGVRDSHAGELSAVRTPTVVPIQRPRPSNPLGY